MEKQYSLAHIITGRARFFWFLGIAFAIFGFLSWFNVAKEEDPKLKPRFGTVQVIYPGASANEMNNIIVREIEKELASISEIEHIDVSIRSEFAFFRIELKGDLTKDADISRAWDEIDSSLKFVSLNFPEGALPPILDKKAMDQEAILIALTGPDKERHATLLSLEEELLKLKNVAKVTRIADEGRQITIAMNRTSLAASGLSPMQLTGQLMAANSRLGGGSMEENGSKVILYPVNGFETISEMQQFPITLPGGGSTALARLATVSETVKLPVDQEMRWNGLPASALGIVARSNIDLVQFGEEVNKLIAEYSVLSNKNVKIEIINSQPKFVADRLAELAFSLLQSMVILGVMMLIFMGLRVGLLVTLMLPLISLIVLAMNVIGGGILHQISIAAFVMSLGLLIDNIIVIAESVQEKLDSGVPALQAATNTVAIFSKPLMSSTLTTIASFLPMALAKGSTSEFTFSIPAIAILALSISWLAAVFLTPTFAAFWLKPGATSNWFSVNPLADSISNIVLNQPRKIVFGIVLLIGVAIFSATVVPQKFFPSADRNQLVVEIAYPEGTSISQSREAVKELERGLQDFSPVKSIASFIGRSTPRFYYNLNQKPNASHLAQLLVFSRTSNDHAAIRKKISEIQLSQNPRVIVRSLEQGPPLTAHFELRLIGEGDLLASAENIMQGIQNVPGTIELRHDVEGLQKELRIKPNDSLLSNFGFSRFDLALATLQTARGSQAGIFRTVKENLPIKMTYPGIEKVSVSALSAGVVGQSPDRAIRIAEASTFDSRTVTSVLHRRDREPVIRILADFEPGIPSAKLLSVAQDYISQNPLPKGVRYEIGGEVGESLKANAAIAAAMPLAMILLISILIFEFNSIRSTLIILTSVPTAALGIMPGLAISQKPFGFLAMLALFALIGIVVNNGILLIDRFKSAQAEGHPPEKAISLGISERLRPILLTSGSTILGMVPLTLTSSTLWPPFAWAMISGLAISTLFTLFIVPLLYLKMPGKKSSKIILASIVFLTSTGVFAETAIQNETITIEQILSEAHKAANVKASLFRAEKAGSAKYNEILRTWGPQVTAGAEYIFRDRDFFLQTPLGSFPYGVRNYPQAGVEIRQTLWSTRSLFGSIPSASNQETAARFAAQWDLSANQFMAIDRYCDCLQLSIQEKIASERIENLQSLRNELYRLNRSGRSREIEISRLTMNLSQASNSLDNLVDGKLICEQDLGRLTGSSVSRRPVAVVNTSVYLMEDLPDDSNRADILALEHEVKALKADRDTILAESLPEISASAAYNHFGANQFTPDSWFSANIAARWRILDGGTQITRTMIKDDELQEKIQLLENARQMILIQQKEARLNFATTLNHIEKIQNEIDKVEAQLRRERARVSQGRVPAAELLQTYDIYWQRREALAIAEVNRIRFYWQTKFVYGQMETNNK